MKYGKLKPPTQTSYFDRSRIIDYLNVNNTLEIHGKLTIGHTVNYFVKKHKHPHYPRVLRHANLNLVHAHLHMDKELGTNDFSFEFYSDKDFGYYLDGQVDINGQLHPMYYDYIWIYDHLLDIFETNKDMKSTLTTPLD